MPLPFDNSGNLTKTQMLRACVEVWNEWLQAAQAEQGVFGARPWFYLTSGPVNPDPWGALLFPLPVGTGVVYLGHQLTITPSLSESTVNGEAIGRWPVYSVKQGIPFVVPVTAIVYPVPYAGWFVYPDQVGVLGPDSGKVLAKGLLTSLVKLSFGDVVTFRLSESVKNRSWP
jgi:hypothetical protein